jgi:hypothetical protein
MRTRRFRVSALALGGLLALAASAHAATLTERFEKTYPFQDGALLALDNTNGGVTIEAWDRDEVRVVAEKKARSDDQAKAREALKQVQVSARPEAGGLRINTVMPKKGSGLWDWMSGGGVSVNVEYRLQVPRRARLDVETTNGGLRVTGTQGKADLETTNGGITLAEVDGDLRLSSTNGGIQATDVAGAVQASTTNGGIEVRLREVPSGSELSFETTNGSVDVRLPRDIRASVDIATSNGKISSDFDVEGGSKSRTRLSGDINGGGGQLRIRTSNGSVEVAQN